MSKREKIIKLRDRISGVKRICQFGQIIRLCVTHEIYDPSLDYSTNRSFPKIDIQI